MTITPPRAEHAPAIPAGPRADAPAGSPTDPPDPGGKTTFVSRGFLARAAFVTVVLSLAGAVLGLGRDQALAHLFGAGRETDAFLVAWTLPEFAATLLIEDGLAFALVPAFSAVVARRAHGDTGDPDDPVRALVRGTLPQLVLAFSVASVLLVWGAPYLVQVLAPGLPDPRLAIDCTRLTGTCVLTFGLAGYCSAVLRAHRRFVAPAAIYVAYNTAVITAMFVFGGRWGVRAAAIGVAVGGALMVVAQLPSVVRELRRRKATTAPEEAATDTTDALDPGDPAASRRAMNLALLLTVLLFALCRQSQVLIERCLASTLPAGAISHLNYAQKVAQMPMVLALMLCTVTFPVVSQALAEGDTERARDRVERDLRAVSCVVLLGTAAVVACAPQLVHVLFQRGAFTAQDTAATAAVMRVYALGLLGHALVGALVRSYFSAGRPTWYPVAAMTAGIVATACLGAWTVGSWGVLGIAAANAAGITLTALILLHGMGTRGVPIRTRSLLAAMGRPLRAAVAACAVGAFLASLVDSPALGLTVGGTAVTVLFLLLAGTPGGQGLTPALRTVTRRLPHARFR
ncbi:murein biosynthesis integral membrane protein MurJ [Streptomyces tailanensis]|uniref:murein biosynthesis integral membrane protein MurJ n=1 Tax=Streptomyces tailanensis TaxID=2569858 RepID=UPI00122E1263|nr:lipid II flippase MurJ [Streptomyces tailanensis]